MTMRSEVDVLMKAAGSESLTAEEIVEAARDAARYPALHQHLWQTSEAELAMEARIARAHRLLISVYISVGESERTRLYVHTDGTPGYQPLPNVVAIPNLAALKLQQLTEDISRARARLRGFRAALPDAVVDEIDTLLARAEQAATAAQGAGEQAA